MPATMTAPGKAPGSGSMGDEDSTSVLALERKSVQPYRDQDEYLAAMKEDLAEWLNTLYGHNLTVDNFFDELETGTILCEHANNVQSFILERLKEHGRILKPRPGHRPLDLDPEKQVAFRSNVKVGSFQCRDNLSNFIEWTHRLGLPDCLLFETEDLVARKNERSVVLCLLEVARQGARYGMQAPLLVQMEEEIDAEIAAEENGGQEEEDGPPPPPPPQRIVCDLMSLDEMVREMLGVCTCPDQFPMYRVSEGKYQIGGSRTLIFVRILRKHVMVRIGGGWDTLENYLDRHDPCRCHNKGHRTPRTPRGGPKRRVSAPPSPNSDVSRSRGGTPEPPKPGGTSPKLARRAQAQDKSKRSTNLAPGQQCSPRGSCETLRSLSPTPESDKPQSTPARKNLSASFDMASRVSTPRKYAGVSSSGYGQTSVARSTDHYSNERQKPQTTPKYNYSTPRIEVDGYDPSEANQGRPTQKSYRDGYGVNNRERSLERSSGIRNRGRSIERNPNSSTTRGRSQERNGTSAYDRGRSRERSDSQIPMSRGRSVERSAIPAPRGRSQERGQLQDMNSRGRVRDRTNNNVNAAKGVRSRSVGADEINRRLMKTAPAAVNRKKNTKDTLMIQRNADGKHTLANQERNGNGKTSGKDASLSILPNKPRIMGRSNTIDSPESYEDERVVPLQPRQRMRSSSSVSLSSIAYDDYPEPEADPTMNEQMERLFEEYRKIELGLITKELNAMTDAANNEDDEQPKPMPSKGNKTPKTGTKTTVKKSSVISNGSSEVRKQSFQRSRTSSRDDLLDGKATSKQTSPTDSHKGRSPTPNTGNKPVSSRGRSPAPVSRGQSPAPSRGRSPAPRSRGQSPGPMIRGRSPAPDQTRRQSETATATTQGLEGGHPVVERRHSTPANDPTRLSVNKPALTRTASSQSARDGAHHIERPGSAAGRHAPADSRPGSGRSRLTPTSTPARTPASTPAETPAQTPSVEGSDEQWPKIDVLCDVPSDEYREREARVMAYVNSVRESMTDSSPSTRASSKMSDSRPASRSTTQQASTPARPGSASSRQQPRRDSAPAAAAAGLRKGTNITRGQSPAPSKMKTARSRSKEDLLDGPSRPASRNTSQTHSTPARGTTPSADKRSRSVVGHSNITRRDSYENLRDGPTTRQSRSNTRNQLSKRRGSEDNIQDNTKTRPKPSTRSQSVHCTPCTSPTTNYPSTQDQAAQTMEFDTPARPSDLSFNVDTAPKTNPRRAKTGGRTRIPMPSSSRGDKKGFEPQPLRRYDSGVDINNMSPTEASLHGDDPWGQNEPIIVNDHHTGYHVSDSDEYF